MRWKSPAASVGSSKPNRLITPSTSTARIGRSASPSGMVPGQRGRPTATIARRAEHQPADPQGPPAPEAEGRNPGAEVRAGSQTQARGAAEARRVHARVHGDPEEAELRAAQ